MTVCSYVGFVAAFPAGDDSDNPPGIELAEFVTAELRSAGFNSGRPEDREGWAWEFITIHKDCEIQSIVGLVDDMKATPPRQWLITNDLQSGFFARLIGGKKLASHHSTVIHEFCSALNRIMHTDSRFTHVVWYNKDTFDMPGDQSGMVP